MINREQLEQAVAPFGVEITDDRFGRLERYATLLVEWNQKMNLTAITDPEGIALKHFADSLALCPHLPSTPFSLIDVGTGAGFPGLPLAILRPDMELTLLDSLNKRLTFLGEVCREVGVRARLVHARAEEGGRQPELREQFDLATARAVAAMPVLSEYCLPFVRVGGRFLAMKGPDGRRETAEAATAIVKLGGRVAPPLVYTLPNPSSDGGVSERQLITVEKIAPTPAKFPRPNVKKAAPL